MGQSAVRLLSLDQLDGRTAAAKAVRAFIATLENDLGGADRLSVGEREIVTRAALASAMLEDMEAKWLAGGSLDIASYTTLANTSIFTANQDLGSPSPAGSYSETSGAYTVNGGQVLTAHDVEAHR